MAIALEACIPPASSLKVGAWVESVAGDSLKERAQRLREAEESTGVNAVVDAAGLQRRLASVSQHPHTIGSASGPDHRQSGSSQRRPAGELLQRESVRLGRCAVQRRSWARAVLWLILLAPGPAPPPPALQPAAACPRQRSARQAPMRIAPEPKSVLATDLPTGTGGLELRSPHPADAPRSLRKTTKTGPGVANSKAPLRARRAGS